MRRIFLRVMGALHKRHGENARTCPSLVVYDGNLISPMMHAEEVTIS